MDTFTDLVSGIDRLLALTPDEQRAHLEGRFAAGVPVPRLVIGMVTAGRTVSSTSSGRRASPAADTKSQR